MGVYLHGVSNRIKRADSTHCCFHLVKFPDARRFNLSRDTVVFLAAVLCLVTQRSSPQTAAHIRTTFLSHCFCGLMKGPIMYQQIENDVSVRAKKDNGTSGRSFNLATDFLSLFFYGGQNRNTEKSSGRKLKVFRGFFALRY